MMHPMMTDPAFAELTLTIYCEPQHFPAFIADTENPTTVWPY